MEYFKLGLLVAISDDRGWAAIDRNQFVRSCATASLRAISWAFIAIKRALNLAE
jgi:hypothetical protein